MNEKELVDRLAELSRIDKILSMDPKVISEINYIENKLVNIQDRSHTTLIKDNADQIFNEWIGKTSEYPSMNAHDIRLNEIVFAIYTQLNKLVYDPSITFSNFPVEPAVFSKNSISIENMHKVLRNEKKLLREHKYNFMTLRDHLCSFPERAYKNI